MSTWSRRKGADDHIRFEWVVGEENGGWETVARLESGIVCRLFQRMTTRMPRWLRRWGWVFVALALLCLVAGGYSYVRYRYERALRQLEWQIQGVIDLEVRAVERRDQDLFLAQQDNSSVRWCARQVQRFEGNCPSPPAGIDVTPSRDQCRPILPSRIRRVDLRGDVARVEVLEQDAVPQVHYYRRTALGWKHTMPPPPEDVVTITFVCHEWQRVEVQEWADLFQRYYPEIRIEIVALEDLLDLSRPESNIIASATRRVLASADTAFWHVDPEAIKLEIIHDLTPFIEADEGLDIGDFYPGTLEVHRRNGSTWALPASIQLWMIFYDRDALDAADVPHPRPGWTLDDLLSATIALTTRNGDNIKRYGFIPLYDPLGVHPFISRGADEQTAFTVEDPELIQRIRWYTDLALKYGVMPNPMDPGFSVGQASSWKALWELVEDGKAAMWSDTLTDWEHNSRNGRLGFVPFPTQGNPWSVSGYVMSAQTPYPQESWLWLRFLTHRRYTRAFRAEVPARKSVAEGTGYWEQWNESETEAIEWALAHASMMGWDAHATWLWRVVKQVFSGQEAEAALAEAWPSTKFRSP